MTKLNIKLSLVSLFNGISTFVGYLMPNRIANVKLFEMMKKELAL